MCWLTAQVLWRNYHSWLRTNLRFSSAPITRLSAWFIIQLHKLILPEKAHNSARATLPWSSSPTLCSQSWSQSFSRTFVSLTSAAMFTSLHGLPASCQKHVSPICSCTSSERDTASQNWSTYCSLSSSRNAIPASHSYAFTQATSRWIFSLRFRKLIPTLSWWWCHLGNFWQRQRAGAPGIKREHLLRQSWVRNGRSWKRKGGSKFWR